jgi:hypothetical protein
MPGFFPSSGKSRNVIPKPDHKNPLAVFFQHGAESLDLSPLPGTIDTGKAYEIGSIVLSKYFHHDTPKFQNLPWLDFSLGDWGCHGKVRRQFR